MEIVVDESFTGGYRRHDAIFSLVDMSNSHGSVKKGEKGKVLGPSKNEKYDLLCEFPNLSGINVFASEVSLAGGFRPECAVFSLFELSDANGSVKMGEKGKVIGPANNQKHDLLCEFPSLPQINVWAGGVSLAGGFRPGCIVVSLRDCLDAHGSVKSGEKGKVVGPAKGRRHDLLCEFPNYSRINMLASTVSLVGGFRQGCAVYSLFVHSDANGNNIKKGERGTVIGPSNNQKHDLLCEFPNFSRINIRASDVSLAGGFRPGCSVSSLYDLSDAKGQVKQGEKGKVIGASTDKDKDLLCEFPNYYRINMLASAVSLAGGFQLGCVVFSLFEHSDENGNVKKGERGKVLGPSNDLKHDLLCEFPNFLHINVWAADVSLAGGFRPGQIVLSVFDLTDTNGSVRKGQKGKVIGPSQCEKYDLLCEFPNYSQINVSWSAVRSAGSAPKMHVEESKVVAKKGSDMKVKKSKANFEQVSEVHVAESKVTVKQDPTLRLMHCCQLSETDIVEAFRNTAQGRFRITRVQHVQEASLIHLVSAYLNIIEQRRIHQPIFDPEVPKNVHKQEVVSALCRHFDTERLAGQGLRKANVLLVWHGPSTEAAARSIAKHGFAPMSECDPGYHGSGRYASLESAYACMYASEYPDPKDPSSNGDWPVVLCAGVVGMAYPVTPCRDDFPKGALPPDDPRCCAYYGAPLQTKFDTHIVPVRGPDYLAVEPHQADFHELVFREDAQLLPIAIVWFKKAPMQL